ncbi:hypothetical protein XU18_2094 [Perkinsela sp. CCAP 1560/4]|nr:hypothetical protein XU18_2094 [Perkinsela sp. CCAP 1560/4]|eukprot:KNH07231.1 hypothetical protein XU18_2094 [Perkinsela sp. CCAP 1560/4]
MRFELLFFKTVDSSIGRVDHESLSQQALMEMVIGEITNKEKICGDVDEPKDIEEWKGVEIEDGEVFGIDWSHYGLRGSVHLEWLPISVRKFLVGWSNLTGTLDLACLPTPMKHLDLRHNTFTGPIDLERLPERMEYLCVSKNQLSGSLNLASLPGTLQDLVAHNNKFSGSVDLTQLPAALTQLDISENELSGSVVLTQLSGSLSYLYLSRNQFSGSLDLTRLPPNIESFNFSWNRLSGEGFIPDEIFERVNVRYTKVIKRRT